MFDDMTQEENPSKVNADINASIRRAYDEVLNQEVPDRFKELLARLRTGEISESSNQNQEPFDTGEHEEGNGGGP